MLEPKKDQVCTMSDLADKRNNNIFQQSLNEIIVFSFVSYIFFFPIIKSTQCAQNKTEHSE